jgi:hypothetical protein
LVQALSAHPLIDLTVQDPTLEEIFKNFYASGGARS